MLSFVYLHSMLNVNHELPDKNGVQSTSILVA